MSRRKSGCCMGFFMGIIFTFAVLIGGVYFGGNYAINSFFGESGTVMPLGVHNWQEVFGLFSAFGKEPDMSAIIDSASAPSEEAKESATGKLKDFGFPMVLDGDGNPTDELDIGKILSGDIDFSAGSISEIELSGAEIASIVNMALDSGAGSMQSFSGLKMEQVQIAQESDVEAGIALTVSVPLAALQENLGPAAFLIKADKIYITCYSHMSVTKGDLLTPAEPGNDKMTSSPAAGKSIKVNDLSDKLSASVINAVLGAFGGGEEMTAEGFVAKLSGMLTDAVNNFGGEKSFLEHASGDTLKPAAIKMMLAPAAV